MIFFVLILAYLIGALPPGYVLGKLLRGIDIREHGSGNIGFTNVLRVLGKGAGAVTLIIDIGKGIVAVVLADIACDSIQNTELCDVYRAVAGALAIIGHTWPVYIGFKGGKGVATGLGVFLALTPLPTACTVGIWCIMVLIGNMVSLASIIAVLALPVLMMLFKYSMIYVIIGVVMALLIVVRHSSNIRRILDGRENKLFKKRNET